jgi:stage V sporulation protein B
MKISNIPIAFASAMAAAIIPTVSQLVARKEMDDAKVKIGQAVKTIMVVSIPSAVGLCVLARPIIGLLFPAEANKDLAVRTLMALAISVVFYALSTLTNSILQGIGRVNVPIVNAVIALILQTVALVPLLLFTDMGIYALVIAATVYSGAMCVLNQISVRKALGYRQEFMKTMFIPGLASVFMGALAWAVYEGMYLLTQSNIISLIPAILLAVTVYFALLILFRGMSENELRAMPKGYLLVKAAKKCKLMK